MSTETNRPLAPHNLKIDNLKIMKELIPHADEPKERPEQITDEVIRLRREIARLRERHDEKKALEFSEGIPAADGYYLVELESGHDKPFDVDYCRAKSPSDGGGREWVSWYAHNIIRWAPLANAQARR
jgi:hypothetical protein